MSKNRPRKAMFSSIARRSSATEPHRRKRRFARRPFKPGDLVVTYSPRRGSAGSRRGPRSDGRRGDQAHAPLGAAIRLSSSPTRAYRAAGARATIGCSPNAAILSDGAGRIESTRATSPREKRSPSSTAGSATTTLTATRCRCGSPPGAAGTSTSISVTRTATHVEIREGGGVVMDGIATPPAGWSTASSLHSIGQEQVQEAIASTLVRIKLREAG